MSTSNEQSTNQILRFYGGWMGALAPFLLFVSGVIYIALSGAPDERGFWPVLILALGLSLLLAKDRKQFSKTVLSGMSEEIVMVMITAWILASMIGVLMRETQFVEALIWLAAQLQLGPVGFVGATFVICCVVSLSTGSSFATILICSPLLYPAGGLLGSHLPTLAGAIIGGATVGDFLAPISDTTIASTLSQETEIGPTVRSRIKYMLPIVILALVFYLLSANWQITESSAALEQLEGDPRGLPMLLVPAFIIYLFLTGKHLLHGLLLGLLFGMALGLVLGLLPWSSILSLDLENFSARSFMIDGINRAVGLSFFTILLMGLVATIKASGLMERLVQFASKRSKTKGQGEWWLAASVGTAVMLTTHSIVAILSVADFAKQIGERVQLSGIRRANILSMVVCVFPFCLPYFIPVILMANTTQVSDEYAAIASVSALEVGLHNAVAWLLLLTLMIVLLTGWGRQSEMELEAK